MLDQELLLAIKNEIQNDPAEIGYSGKTSEEIANLINNERVTITTVIDAKPLTITEVMGVLSQQSISNMLDCPNMEPARLAIINQDRVGAAFWLTAFYIKGIISEEEKTLLEGLLVSTEEKEVTTNHPPRIIEAFASISGMPNQLTSDDIDNALAIQTEE